MVLVNNFSSRDDPPSPFAWRGLHLSNLTNPYPPRALEGKEGYQVDNDDDDEDQQSDGHDAKRRGKRR